MRPLATDNAHHWGIGYGVDVVVGRKLNLSAEEQSQQYRRMVFNVLAENKFEGTESMEGGK